jgi:collagenase-like PrtC family protease
MNAPRLSLGPLQFHWPHDAMREFYASMATSPVDIVYLGETVCSKRREFSHRDWVATAEMLLAAGKEIVFSTLALIEAQSEVGYLRRLCESGEFMLEANDIAAVQLLGGRAPYVGGPTLNINNQRTLARLVDTGLRRWVAPVEMTLDMFTGIRQAMDTNIEYELLAWGRLPLAYSARCYTARAYDLNKDDCGNCCIDHPDGLDLNTRDDEDFLVLNGIQTMSAKTFYRFADGDLGGADVLRVSPQAYGTEAVLHVLDRLRHEDVDANAAFAALAENAPHGVCDGYWHGGAGMAGCAPREAS